jgi:hypothetical protein
VIVGAALEALASKLGCAEAPDKTKFTKVQDA